MRRLPFLYALPLASLALAVTGHAGDDHAAIDFARDIKPIFAERCYECHGPDKQKGRLRLDGRAFVFRDSNPDPFKPKDPDPVIVPGKPDDSLLLSLVELDADDPDIMPAEGDPLSAEQIARLRAWIEQGAVWPESADTPAPTPVDDGLGMRGLDPAQTAAETQALAAIQQRGGLAMRVAANTNVVDVNFSLVGASVGDDDLKLLAGLEPTLVWLNLARTSIGDAGLAQLAGFAELRRLNLSTTRVTDAGLTHLAQLGALEYLNLYGTEVSDAGIATLAGMASLRRVYLWQSKVTAEGAARLKQGIPEVLVDRGDYVVADLPAPEAKDLSVQPVNPNCPFTGKPVNGAQVVIVDGIAIGLCCANCKAEFEKDPAANALEVAEFVAAKAAATPAPAAPEPVAPPVVTTKAGNDKCPVSGRPASAEFTIERGGRVIAFCCNDCKAKFEQDPGPYLKALSAASGLQIVNAKCPFTGKAVNKAQVVTVDGIAIGLCCANCKAEFEKDPAANALKVAEFVAAKAAAATPAEPAPATPKAPINDQCPVSGGPVGRDFTVEHGGKVIAFCCDKCQARFVADPAPFLKALGIE